VLVLHICYVCLSVEHLCALSMRLLYVAESLEDHVLLSKFIFFLKLVCVLLVMQWY